MGLLGFDSQPPPMVDTPPETNTGAEDMWINRKKEKRYYVTMTDPIFSYEGKAEGKIAKYVYTCDSYEEAEIVRDNARGRGDQKYINVVCHKPRYNSSTHYTQWKNKENCGKWYERGAWSCDG